MNTKDKKILEMIKLTGMLENIQMSVDKYLEPLGEKLNDEEIEKIAIASIPVYERHFTDDDIDSIIEWFSTDAGQAFLMHIDDVMDEISPATEDVVSEIVQNKIGSGFTNILGGKKDPCLN